MSEKRRDRKNRILKDGESQKRDGRYRFCYTDIAGNKKELYSWRLDKNDPHPPGKRKDLSLREKEKQVEKDIANEIITNGGNYTVITLVEKYVSLKIGIRRNTEKGYKTVLNLLYKDPFGQRRIDSIKMSDAKAWLIKLQSKDGKGYSTIHTIRGVLRPAFQMAEDDDLIRKNPFRFELSTVVVNDSVTREAITRKQQREYLRFIKEDRVYSKYYDGIFILFGTGLRISEFCGLTVSDIDLKNKRIKVDHQLIRTNRMEYFIEKPKTESGKRFVPMTNEVAECFQRILSSRQTIEKEPVIDGYTGFLFFDRNSMPMVALHWQKYMKRIRDKYNKIYREPLPEITPHICRHTFCSNMAKSGMNPKTLQYIMGHADISVTIPVPNAIKGENGNQFHRKS